MIERRRLAECVGGHLEVAGPVTVEQLVADAPAAAGSAAGCTGDRRPGPAPALARLEAPGSAIELPDGRWCARHLLVRLHGASRQRRRGLVEPVPIADFVRFLACWQHVAAGDPGRRGAPAAGGARTAPGHRGAGGGVGGADAPGPGRRLRRPMAR